MSASISTLYPPHAVEFRQCPKCGYTISQGMIDEMKDDPCCVRCLEARLSQFKIYRQP